MTRCTQILVNLPLPVSILIRVTVVLGVGWILHFCLRWSNPRWRMLLWRGVIVGVLSIPVLTPLKYLEVGVRPPSMPEGSSPTGAEHVLAPVEPLTDITKTYPIHSAGETWPEMPNLSRSSFSLVRWTQEHACSLAWCGWALAAGAMSIRFLTVFVRIRKQIRASLPAPKYLKDLLSEVAADLHCSREITLMYSRYFTSPFLTGLTRPIIVLPERMIDSKYADELPAIFAHELAHLRSQDLWWMAAARWVGIIAWFHPLGWKLRDTHSAACEEVCDAVAADYVGNAESYSGTLARIALEINGRVPVVGGIPIVRSSEIIRRLTMLKQRIYSVPLAKHRVALSLFIGFVGLAAIGGLRLVYAGEAAMSKPQTRILHFPKHRSMGLVYVGELRSTDPLWWQGWEEVGEAKGNVTLPADKDVRLTVNAQGMENLSFLEALGPEDIQALEFSYSDAKRVDDAALGHLAKLTGLKFLSLDNTSIRGAGLEHLTKLNKLEALRLASTEIVDEALKHVGQISTLVRLNLARTPVTDQGLAHLHNLTSLRNIALTQTSITGTGFSHLGALESLTYAHLCDSGLTDEGLREVAKLNSLEILRLEGTKITGRGIGHLEHLTRLRELGLASDSGDITDASLEHIGRIASLEWLMLRAEITDAGLQKLTSLKNLKYLNIPSIELTDVRLGPLKNFTKLENLVLPSALTDEDLAAISTLTSLEELIMNSSPITNKGLAQLAGLKSLERLTLHHGHKSVDMDITVSGVGALKGLPLRDLVLHNIKLDESRYAAIGAFGALEFLYLSSMPIIDEDLAVVGKLSQLKRLLFNTDTVSDGGLEYLVRLNHLEDFQPITPLTDIGLSHIGKMKLKGRLIVKGYFTDEGLRHLEGLTSLRTLKLTTSGEISPEAQERLKKKLPNLQTCGIRKSREVREPPKVGEAAPPFALNPLDEDSDSSEEISLEGKAVLLYFWATWCTPCKASTPALKRLYAELKKRHGDRFVMLGLSLESNKTSVRRYVEKEAIPWPQICISRNSQTAVDYGVTGVPMYYVIGPDGKIVFSDHEDKGDTIEAAVGRALSKK